MDHQHKYDERVSFTSRGIPGVESKPIHAPCKSLGPVQTPSFSKSHGCSVVPIYGVFRGYTHTGTPFRFHNLPCTMRTVCTLVMCVHKRYLMYTAELEIKKSVYLDTVH